ncbi:hypothetical protein MVEN_01790400 [Mycena venus]|uniref:Uncharacterized protein n=1 Tax=Mycena venus TaxID=2733690 RepID=A0A8H6XK88_9AGAR|nr:hypothetical protein MVEN_01790400 [Mycena venus]
MPVISEEHISTLTSALPTKVFVALVVVTVAATVIYHMSPLRLVGVLITAIDKAEETYVDAHGMGLLHAAETEMLNILQLKVSAIVEETLYNSLSWQSALREFLQGRTFTLLRCISEVQMFETRIKISKESQLRSESNLNPRAIFLRRRGLGSRYGGGQSHGLA